MYLKRQWCDTVKKKPSGRVPRTLIWRSIKINWFPQRLWFCIHALGAKLHCHKLRTRTDNGTTIHQSLWESNCSKVEPNRDRRNTAIKYSSDLLDEHKENVSRFETVRRDSWKICQYERFGNNWEGDSDLWISPWIADRHQWPVQASQLKNVFELHITLTNTILR
jgi:hypothetical protein